MVEVSILIPAYNSATFIGETIKSILNQSFEDYEIIICDDCSTDNTGEVIKRFKDRRIRYYRNKRNLDYPGNLRRCYEKAKGDIIFLMAHDDILLKDALLKTYNAFQISDEIGVVTRPYYWFWNDVYTPIRAIRPYDSKKDSIVSIFDGKKSIYKLFESAGQLSGLAFRKEYMDVDFSDDIFTAHIYPFASILKRYKAVYLKDYTVAVRTPTSMSRHRPEIYNPTPTEQWIKMFNTIYYGDKKYEEIRKECIKFICKNFAGLIQLKTTANMRILLKDISILLKYYPLNVFDPKFWFYSLGAVLTPSRLLRWFVDQYKIKILSKMLKKDIMGYGKSIWNP